MPIRTAISAFLIVAFMSGGVYAQPSSITVAMKAENGSGENGTATLSQTPKGISVVVDITGAPAAAQPMHIHPGICPKIDLSHAIPLNPLDGGKSTTMLNGKKLSDLTGGKFTINVHKSADDIKTYVSCGDIK